MNLNFALEKKILKSGFKVNIQYFQRYNFANHLGWLIKNPVVIYFLIK